MFVTYEGKLQRYGRRGRKEKKKLFLDILMNNKNKMSNTTFFFVKSQAMQPSIQS